MALDAETKKLFAGDQWAIDGDRLNVESSDGAPVIDRSIGFQSEFSTTKTINREKLNQIICELSGAAKAVREGIPAYDATISYPPASVVKVNGELYYQSLDVNSTGVHPTTAGNTTWALAAGVSQAERVRPPALSTNDIIIDGDRADRFNVRLVIDNTGGYPIDQVNLQYSKDSNFSSGVSDDDNYTQGADKIISGGDSDLYYVRIRLHNDLGWGGWSNAKDVGSPISPIGPSSASAEPGSSSGSVVVSWGGVLDNGLSITKHTIQYKTSTQAWSSALAVDVSNSNGYGPGSHTITGLTNGTAYDFRVKATSNRITDGGWVYTTATPINYPRKPDAPVVIADGLSTSSVVAYISGDTNNNGSNITGWKWQIRVDGGSFGSEISTSAPYHIFTGLSPDTDYDVQVKAVNSLGTSAASTINSASTNEVGKPTTPLVYAFRTGRTQAFYYMAGDLTDNGGASVSKYRMQYKQTGTTQWSSVQETNIAAGFITSLGLKTTYDVRFAAYNGTQWSDWVSASLGGFQGIAPSNVSISAVSGGVGKVAVSLGATIDDGGDPITGYTWQYKKASASNWTTWRTRTIPYDVIVNLAENVDYDFRVQATNNFGTTTSADIEFTVETDNAAPNLSGDISRRGNTDELYAPVSLRSDGNYVSMYRWEIRRRTRSNTSDPWSSWESWIPLTTYPTGTTIGVEAYVSGSLRISIPNPYRQFQVRVQAVSASGNSDWLVKDFT
ncbi:MAG: fibronectin type III domain-containing protein [Gammaproteobacteria bacterium AqS3]|nr:fibronectin type III domain-containing protein [Gammaproteobacteria bacterium AqS3]